MRTTSCEGTPSAAPNAIWSALESLHSGTPIGPGRVYADRTVFGDVELTFRHDLTPSADGGTTVTHTLFIHGAGVDELGPELGPQITADFPEAMAELLAAAER